jgi:CubicO group peptidase (beta-lactamase class C family)
MCGVPFGSAVAQRTRATLNAGAGQTVFHSFSTVNGITITLAHVLARHGLIDHHALVRRYWPQLAAHGKSQWEGRATRETPHRGPTLLV